MNIWSISLQNIRSKIAKTIYPGLESHPQNSISKKQQITPHGDIIFGSMVSIVFHSKIEMEAFIKKINLFSLHNISA